MKKHLLLCAAILMGYTATSAQKRVEEFQTSEARTLDLYPSTYIHPLIADVVVDTKTGRIHDKWVLTATDLKAREIPNNFDATLKNLKAYGLFKSSEKHNCDIIVAANFDIRLTADGAEINLVGYPANFANWSTGTSADYEWITKEKFIEGYSMPQDEKKNNRKK